MKDNRSHKEVLLDRLREARRTRAQLETSAAGWRARGNKIAVRKCHELIANWDNTISAIEDEIALIHEYGDSYDEL
jgi:hypothetical protein